MSKYSFSIYLVMISFIMQAQDMSFTTSINPDTVLLGNYFEVTFTLENARGQNFVPPLFEDFSVLSGPNQSSSFSMVNGEVSQSLSVSYFLEPGEIGTYTIDVATIDVADETFETLPLEVIVVQNPRGLQLMPRNKKEDKKVAKRKKKRKQYKI